MLRIGHRGAPLQEAANTLASFQAAFRLGCDWVECDCRAAADGVIVLAHDPQVTDASGRTHVVGRCSSRDLGSLDLGRGEGVPTLMSLVEWAADRVGVMADVKEDGRELEVGRALRALPTERRMVVGASAEGRARFREIHPDLTISTTLQCSSDPEAAAQLNSVDTPVCTPHFRLLDPGRVGALRERGIIVCPWTVNDLGTMRRLRAWGVDGIITDRLDLLGNL